MSGQVYALAEDIEQVSFMNKALQKESPKQAQLFELFLSAMPSLSKSERSLLTENFETSFLLAKKKLAANSSHNAEKQLIKLCNFFQNKYFKTYKPHSTLATTLGQGDFDCLSGTALMAAVLHQAGYVYQIKETAHHVFLVVSLPQKEVLIECTDPLDMLVSDPKEIQKRLQNYATEPLKAEKNEVKLSEAFCKDITQQELAGLLLFNAAVEKFNQQIFSEAVQLLETALIYYPSTRCKELLFLASRSLQDFGNKPGKHLASE
ncbi:MAG: hypothetical protein EAZ67_10700 [Cytophagales bacterium]|nr:MAG: hypothetical protein EAZ67_10700 [Cytophagales bacterium]